MTQADAARVVLVHGLWMNRLAMLPLAWRLERRGFHVTRHGYRSVSRGLRDNARRLAATCRKSSGRLHLVGHSLGGLVIMAMMRDHPEIPVQRVVLIGSPYADSAAAHRVGRFAWSRRMIGRTMRDWLREPRPAVPAGVELGVIAGVGVVGLGRLLAALPPPNDGVVMVEETRVPGATDSIVLRTSHSAMLVSASVACATCAFLAHGKFAT